jgi:acyl dehydratase
LPGAGAPEAVADRLDWAAMASVEVQGVEGMQAVIGQEIGPSEWRPVTQDDINAFAELSGDHQWIHVDVERAKNESPFGTTIAHGNLTLSLVDGFRGELIDATGFALGVNYGWDKIRFPAPVPVDSKVRARAEVVSVEEKGGGWYQVVTRFTIEVEGSDKPCFVGDSVTRVMAP